MKPKKKEERVLAEGLPPRQQDGDEGRRLMEHLVDAIDRVREKYAGINMGGERPKHKRDTEILDSTGWTVCRVG
jgi:hypothetical protein